MKFFSATYQAFIPVSHPHQSKSIAQIFGPKITTINFGVISELTPKTAMFFLAFSPNWCHGAEAWEAPYQFPLPLEGRYWDGDFRCDGADAERPCRGGGEDGYRCRYEISTVICVHMCTLYTMCIQYIYI